MTLNLNPEPAVNRTSASNGAFIIKASWTKPPESEDWFLAGSGYLSFYHGAEWPSGTGSIKANKDEAQVFYWKDGYLGALVPSGANQWLSWNDDWTMPVKGGCAQTRLWAASVRWKLDKLDGVNDYLVPTDWAGRRLCAFFPKSGSSVLAVRDDFTPLMVTLEPV